MIKQRHITSREVNAAIKLPKKITTEDGRELRLVKWMPVVDIEDLTRVTLEAIICLPDSHYENQTQ